MLGGKILRNNSRQMIDNKIRLRCKADVREMTAIGRFRLCMHHHLTEKAQTAHCKSFQHDKKIAIVKLAASR